MGTRTTNKSIAPEIRRRRWLLGLEPIFEGGWLHKVNRAAWDVEGSLSAISLFGDVTVDLTSVKSMPIEVAVNAFAILRDVNVLVTQGTQVQLSGRTKNDHLNNQVPVVPDDQRTGVVRVKGHTLLGDVTVRTSEAVHEGGGR